MVNEIGGIDPGSLPQSTTTSTTQPPPGPNQPLDNENRPSTTDTIAALTVAILSVIVIITILLLVRAIRKRRQARQGRELNPVATISTGVMGTGVAAYSNAAMDWEPVNHDQEMTVNPSSQHRS